MPSFPWPPRRGCFRLPRLWGEFFAVSSFQGINLAFVAILMGFSSGLALWLQLPGGSSLLTLAPLLFIFAIFYFLLIMPQQRRQKKWQAMLS